MWGFMPRRNPKIDNSSKGWRGRLGRKGRTGIYVTKYEIKEEEKQDIKPGDVIEVLIMTVTRRGEGIGKYKGRSVTVIGASDPGIKVKAKVKKVQGGKVLAELMEY